MQIYITELSEPLREIYVMAYTLPSTTEYILKSTAVQIKAIFSPFMPDAEDKDFYEMDIACLLYTSKKAVVVYGAFIFMLCMVLGSDRTVYEHFRSVMSGGIHILLGGVAVPLTVLVAGRKKQSGGEKK